MKGYDEVKRLPRAADQQRRTSEKGLVILRFLPSLLVLGLFASPAFSCSCGWADGSPWNDPPPLTEGEVRLHRAVFEGRATSVEVVEFPVEEGSAYGIKAELEVVRVWRGPRERSFVLYSPFSTCAFEFEVGRSYVVFADRLLRAERRTLGLPRSTLTASTCTRTTGEPQEVEAIRTELDGIVSWWAP